MDNILAVYAQALVVALLLGSGDTRLWLKSEDDSVVLGAQQDVKLFRKEGGLGVLGNISVSGGIHSTHSITVDGVDLLQTMKTMLEEMAALKTMVQNQNKTIEDLRTAPGNSLRVAPTLSTNVSTSKFWDVGTVWWVVPQCASLLWVEAWGGGAGGGGAAPGQPGGTSSFGTVAFATGGNGRDGGMGHGPGVNLKGGTGANRGGKAPRGGDGGVDTYSAGTQPGGGGGGTSPGGGGGGYAGFHLSLPHGDIVPGSAVAITVGAGGARNGAGSDGAPGGVFVTVFCPTQAPTPAPTPLPTLSPSAPPPTQEPTSVPTANPTAAPTPTPGLPGYSRSLQLDWPSIGPWGQTVLQHGNDVVLVVCSISGAESRVYELAFPHGPSQPVPTSMWPIFSRDCRGIDSIKLNSTTSLVYFGFNGANSELWLWHNPSKALQLSVELLDSPSGYTNTPQFLHRVADDLLIYVGRADGASRVFSSPGVFSTSPTRLDIRLNASLASLGSDLRSFLPFVVGGKLFTLAGPVNNNPQIFTYNAAGDLVHFQTLSLGGEHGSVAATIGDSVYLFICRRSDVVGLTLNAAGTAFENNNGLVYTMPFPSRVAFQPFQNTGSLIVSSNDGGVRLYNGTTTVPYQVLERVPAGVCGSCDSGIISTFVVNGTALISVPTLAVNMGAPYQITIWAQNISIPI